MPHVLFRRMLCLVLNFGVTALPGWRGSRKDAKSMLAMAVARGFTLPQRRTESETADDQAVA